MCVFTSSKQHRDLWEFAAYVLIGNEKNCWNNGCYNAEELIYFSQVLAPLGTCRLLGISDYLTDRFHFFFLPAADGKTFVDTNRTCGTWKIVKYQILLLKIESGLLKRTAFGVR